MNKHLTRFLHSSLLITFLTISCKKDDPATVTGPQQQVNISNLVTGDISTELNPSGKAPLTARLSFTSPEPTSVSIEVLGDIPVAQSFESKATSHVIPVLGLYPNTTNQVVVRVSSNVLYAVDTLTIDTDSLFYALPDIEIIQKGANMEPGMNLCGLSLGNDGVFSSNPIMFDSNGDIRWHLNLMSFPRISWPIKRLANGNLFFGSESTIYEYNMLGEEIRRWNLSGYDIHHEVVELPNGNFVIAVSKHFTTINDGTGVVNSVEDHIIEIDRSSGNVVTEWDLRQILDVDRHDLTNGNGDWFHMNGIAYQEEDDCLIVSGRNQGVVKINRKNELIWILAPDRGWGNAGEDGTGPATAPYLLKAVDGTGAPYANEIQDGSMSASDFDWTWGQHAPLILENGNLMLFDNGFSRFFDPAATDNYSRAVEYQIDEGNKTIREMWSYGKSRGLETYSMIISDVDQLANGNVLFLPGVMFQAEPYAKFIELDYPGNNVVFEAKIKFKNALGSGAFGWGQFDIMYRAHRMSLYP